MNVQGSTDRFNVRFTLSPDISATRGAQDRFVLISDASFDGQEKTIEFNIERRDESDKYALVWRNITQD